MMELPTDDTVTAHTGSSMKDSKVNAGSSTIVCSEEPNDFGDNEEIVDCKKYFSDSNGSSSGSNNSSRSNFLENLRDSYLSGPDDSVTRTPDSKTDSYLPAPLTPAPHTATVQLADLRKKYNSFKSLAKKSTSSWNDRNAHIVYSSLEIKRYFVDANYILFPDDGKGTRRVTDILQKQTVAGSYWSDIEPKIERILSIFDEETCKITDTDKQDEVSYKQIRSAVYKNIEGLMPNAEGRFRRMEKGFHLSLFRFLGKLIKGVREGKNIPESFYENFLYELFHLFFSIVGCDAKIKKTFDCDDYELEIESLGPRQQPQADFFLTTYLETLLAVVEVKPPHRQLRCFANYQASCVPSCKRPKVFLHADAPHQENLKDQDDAAEAADDVLEMEDEEADKDNDEYEIAEGWVEERRSKNKELESHIRNLKIEEKKQMRCFLPQLLGQILACFPVREQCIADFRRDCAPLRLGIGMVGLKVRFVSVVLKDSKGALRAPVASDIEKRPSVKPHVYVTEELNLFHRRHLGIFFKTLFALCSLEDNLYSGTLHYS